MSPMPTTRTWAVVHQMQIAPTTTISMKTRPTTVTRPIADQASCNLETSRDAGFLNLSTARPQLTRNHTIPAADVGTVVPAMTE